MACSKWLCEFEIIHAWLLFHSRRQKYFSKSLEKEKDARLAKDEEKNECRFKIYYKAYMTHEEN